MVYGVQGNLWAVAFDLSRLETVGDPVPVQEGVLTKAAGTANFSVAENGSLVYMPGDAETSSGGRTLVWVDRSGEEEPLALPGGDYLVCRPTAPAQPLPSKTMCGCPIWPVGP